MTGGDNSFDVRIAMYGTRPVGLHYLREIPLLSAFVSGQSAFVVHTLQSQQILVMVRALLSGLRDRLDRRG